MSRRRAENARSEVGNATSNVKFNLNSLAIDWVPTDTKTMSFSQTHRRVNGKPLLSSLVEKSSSWFLEHRPKLLKKSSSTYCFVKRDPDESICEKIARLNILLNQFYAALAIFSAPPPPMFVDGGTVL